MGPSPADAAQLEALAALVRLFDRERVEYWLFGGWAVDFHAGRVTRAHGDLDLAVWAADRDRVDGRLRDAHWRHEPEAGEDGSTCYVRGDVRLELAFLATDEAGRVFTPLRNVRGEWPAGTFRQDTLELHGVRARVVDRKALILDKSEPRDDPAAAARDRSDVETLRGGATPGGP